MWGWLERGLVLVATVVAIAGCDPGPLAIERNQRPDPGTCALSAAAAGDPIDDATFDLVLGDRSSYVLTPVVRNHTEEPVVVRTATVTLRWHVEGALRPLSIVCEGGERCSEWTLPLCSFAGDCPTIPAGGAASFEVPVLPAPVTRYFLGELDAAVAEGRTPPEYRTIPSVRLSGEGASGEAYASPPFELDLRVCLGCLVTFPDAADLPGLPGEDCCGPGLPPTTCLPGQDDPIDCRACRAIVPEICNFGILTCSG